MSLSASDLSERASADRELRKLKHPVLELADALQMWKRAIQDLQWAIQMTDPGPAKEGFDQTGADQRLRQAIPNFHRARDHVEFLLDRDGWR